MVYLPLITNDPAAPEVSGVDVRAAGASVRVRVKDAALVPDLRRALRGLLGAAGPGASEIAVVPDGRGWHVETPTCGARTFTDPGELRDWVEWAACEALLSALQDRVALHAAGALAGDRAIVVLGPSGAGKSTLAATWLQDGHPLYGDDAVLLAPDGTVGAFRRLGKLHVGSGEIWLDPEDAEGPGWAPDRRAAVVALVSWQRGAPVRIEPVAPGAVLALAVGERLAGTAERVFSATAAALEGARVLRVTFGDARAAARALADRA